MRSVLLLSALLLGGCNDLGIRATSAPPEVFFVDDTVGDTDVTAPIPVNPGVAEQGLIVEFLVEITDDGGAQGLLINFDSDRDGALADNSAWQATGGTPPSTAPEGASGALFFEGDDLYSFTTTALSLGEHAITVTAKDNAGNIVAETHEIEIVDAFAGPTIDVKYPRQNQQIDDRSRVEILLYVEDEEDEPEQIVVDVSSDLDGLLCEPGVDALGMAMCATVLSAGRHTLLFTATDSDGYTAEAIVVASVGDGLDRDDDGDGFTENEGDCLDTNASVYPSATETCDGFDQDCDNVIDDHTVCFDDDGDGYTELQGDCDDDNAAIYPASVAIEIYYDGVDQNCDGADDYDQDLDGFTRTGAPHGTANDCDDLDQSIFPGAVEICNGFDDNCNGCADEGIGQDFYPDYDGDGWGNDSGDPVKFCSAPQGRVNAEQCVPGAPGGDLFWSTSDADCYDSVAGGTFGSSAHPGAFRGTETWPDVGRGDGSFDYDCDGVESRSFESEEVWDCHQTTTTLGDSQIWFNPGWDGGVPACGETATWYGGCDFDLSLFQSGAILGASDFTKTEPESITIRCR